MVKSYLIDGKQAKSLFPTPIPGGQHWERFHVLGRVDYLIVHGLWWYSSVSLQLLYEYTEIIYNKIYLTEKVGFLRGEFGRQGL